MLLCFIDDVDKLSVAAIDSSTKIEVYALAGYVLSSTDVTRALAEVESVKATHGLLLSDPVKWNLKDTALQKAYKKRDRESKYVDASSQSDALRSELLEVLGQVQATVFVSAIWPFSETPQRYGLLQWAFENLLQRVGLHAKIQYGGQAPPLQVVVDRPDRDELNASYRAAYYEGRTSSGQAYLSGPLKDLGATDTLCFASTLDSNFLQLADLVAGASKTFLSWCHKRQDKRLARLARRTFTHVANQLARHATSGQIDGTGFKISPDPGFLVDARIVELTR